MATAEELLNSVLKNEASVLSATDAVFVIDGESRTINVPDSERLFGVEGDKDVERKYFQCPKIVGDNIDLSQHQIYVSYAFTTTENSTSFPDADGLYHCEDVEVSGDNITFSWLLSGNVFANPGFIAFKVMAKKSEGEELKTKWNTAPAIGSVLLTVPDGEEIAEEYPDVINQILDRLDAIEESGSSGYVLPVMTETKLGGGKAIAKTTESVPVAADENGQLWVPEQSGGSSGNTVSVEVESTTTGEPGTDASVTNTGDSQNVKLAFVIPKGETGETGSQGPAGATGTTPNIQIGEVTTLEPGQQATASITGTAENPVLNMGIPKGKDGNDGESNERNATPLTDAGREHIPAIVSFIDDDCRSEVYTVLFPLIKNLEIPYTIACPTGSINNSLYITDAQLKEMYDYGVSVSCHTVNQTNMDTVDRNQLREILQQSIDDLSGWGIDDVRTYAYCQGKYTIDNIQVVKEFFDMGFLTDKGINEIPYESYYMKRVGLFPSTGNFTLANAKEYVDQLSESGGWLIFMTHCYTETFNSEELSELVAYIKGKSIPIVDINDAIDKTGNVIEAGHYKKNDLDSGHYFVVDSLGRMHTDSVIGNSGDAIELVDLVLNEGHQIGKEASSENKGKDIEMTSGNTTHVVSRPVDVTDCTSVIITGWAYSGYGIYSFLNSSGECVSALWSTHSLAEGADSVENQEVSVPEGASTIIIAGHKDYIMPALKKVKSSGSDSGSGESYELPIMSDTQLGGGKAVAKTSEDVPVAVDPSTGQLFVPTYPENTGGDTINVDAELKEYMNVAKPAIASAIINKGGSVEPDDSLNDYATRISTIPNDVYPAETLPAQTNLSASGLQETIGIKLNWSNVNASGYLILRKENAMPATSADGDIVYSGTYAADGYTDTGVQKGKVYYYRIFPRNSKNQYQSLEDGAVAMVDYKDRAGQTLLGDLPLGTKIKFGQWNGSDFFWEVVDTLDKGSGFVTVAADQDLGIRQFDVPEPNCPITNRKTQGNNRWAYSPVRQLLNSDQDTGAWWTAQYEYDAEPIYAAQIPGFLKDFTAYEKGIVVTKTNKCILPNDDGGGTETVQDKFWFPSYYAMGLGVIQPLEDNHIYEKFVDNESRSYQSSYWLRSIHRAETPSVVVIVNSNGSSGSYTASSYAPVVRPFCQLPTSAYMTWSDSDEAYVFADDSQRNHSAS